MREVAQGKKTIWMTRLAEIQRLSIESNRLFEVILGASKRLAVPVSYSEDA